MVEIFGKSYYIDIDVITDKCRTGNNVTSPEEEIEDDGTLEINVFKYEIIKMCLERVLSEYEESNDDEIGVFAKDSLPISFRIAFNTLIKNQILIEDDE